MRSESDFDRNLAALAEVCIVRGVNLQRRQELIVSAPLEAAFLVRHVARRAYARGAKFVTCVYEDPLLIRDRIIESDIEALAYAPDWMSRGIAEGLSAGAARLQVVGPCPDLLSGVAADRIVRAHGALAHASHAEAQLIASAATNWSVVPIVTGSWARQVFPDVPEEQAQRQLWDAVFDVTRVVEADPLQAWDTHLLALNARRDALQSRNFRSLRFFDGRTDLRVDLAEGHRWLGGTITAANGVDGTQNIPTEEIFTALDRNAAHGHVLFSKPLALGGAAVEQLYAEFENGALTTMNADRGLEIFERLIAADQGARRLGEVGLVPATSRIARTGITFWNPLFDRNAASHVAFGQSPAAGLGRRDSSAGNGNVNDSVMHIDCTLGHAAMQVDGVTRSGDAVPVMRNGEFVDQMRV